jgi:hypothetical protein
MTKSKLTVFLKLFGGEFCQVEPDGWAKFAYGVKNIEMDMIFR